MKHIKKLLADRKFKVIKAATIGLFFLTLLFSIGIDSNNIKDLSYLEFNKYMKENKIQEVYVDLQYGEKMQFLDIEGNLYETDNPKKDNFKDILLNKDIDVHEIDSRKNQKTFAATVSLIPTIIFMIVMTMILKTLSKSNAGDTTSIIGKSKSKRVVSDSNIKFSDIAGNEEAKDKVLTVVNFLKNPKPYKDMGAKLPKGMMFYGLPGTGKTMMAKAIAGEAGVPFYSMNGSDFVEKFVGVGASRVRSLFQEAKQNAPCVVFIDEIDAVGSKRDKSGGNEKDQTINALLTELDGFNDNSGIIVIAATNRLDMLDDALIRSGRFDQHICIDLPQQKDRLEILKLYTKNKPLSLDVNLERLSKETQGFSGADLATLINNAAIFAVDRKRTTIGKLEIEEAHNKIVLQGDRKKNGHEDKDDLELVAWHEAGHAIMTKLFTKDSVPKVTVMPATGGVGGYAIRVQAKEHFRTKKDLTNDIMISYAGRVGELLLRKDENYITSGASNDIEKATQTIMTMVEYYGMSESIGMLNVECLGEFVDKKEVGKEIKKIQEDLFNTTYSRLKHHRAIVEELALKLIEEETVYEDDLDTMVHSYLEKIKTL